MISYESNIYDAKILQLFIEHLIFSSFGNKMHLCGNKAWSSS